MSLTNSRVAVIGAGTMGSGIAQKYASHGFIVQLIDQNPASLEKSKAAINANLQAAIERGLISQHDAQSTFARMIFENTIEASTAADLVIEAIYEDLSVKRKLFSQLDALLPSSTLIATNTSSFKVSDLQIGLKNPERVLGLHYFFPPLKNRLVEIIGTDLTSKEHISRAHAYQEAIAKTIIHTVDSPGFVVNRFFVPWLNEAARIVSEDVHTILTVEKAAQIFFNIDMGPFKLMNITGLPITLHASSTLEMMLGDFYRPSSLINKQINKREPFAISGHDDESAYHDIGMRLLLVTAAICCHMVKREKIASESDIDLGARVGLAWKKGPFALMRDHRDILEEYIESKATTKMILPDIKPLHMWLATQ